jgi:hypothetical protein
MEQNGQDAMGLIKKSFDLLLQDLEVALENYYSGRLVSTVVFGSVGRGTPRPDSDVDILIVANPSPNGRMRRVQEFLAIEERLGGRLKSLERHGFSITLAPIFRTPAEVQCGSLLYLDMIRDGRILYDPTGFWRTYIECLERKLHALGAKRIVQGERWYWDLKPDYRPGEIFEI